MSSSFFPKDSSQSSSESTGTVEYPVLQALHQVFCALLTRLTREPEFRPDVSPIAFNTCAHSSLGALVKTFEVEYQLEPHSGIVPAIIHMDMVDVVSVFPGNAAWIAAAGHKPVHESGGERRVPFIAHFFAGLDRFVGFRFPPDPFPAVVRDLGYGIRPILVDQVQCLPVLRIDPVADLLEFPVFQDVPPYGVHVFQDEFPLLRGRR